MIEQSNQQVQLINDFRFKRALELFNSGEWYPAHDAFEELWHESDGVERITLQGILQIAVAQVHLENGNLNGATILFGEGLGRLKGLDIPDFGLDLEKLCNCVDIRLKRLQMKADIKGCKTPFLYKKKDLI